MASKSEVASTFRQSLFQAGLYKSSQGRVARQITFAVLVVTFALAAWRSNVTLGGSTTLTRFANWAGSKFVSLEDELIEWEVGDKSQTEQARQKFSLYRSRGFYGQSPVVDDKPIRRFDDQAGRVVMQLGEKRGYQAPYAVRSSLAFGLPIALLVIGCWGSYRLVNYPRFADFLIAVEAEMNKVSWPSKGELVRSSMVVIFVIFALAFLLAGFDTVWMTIFTWMKVLR